MKGKDTFMIKRYQFACWMGVQNSWIGRGETENHDVYKIKKDRNPAKISLFCISFCLLIILDLTLTGPVMND